MPTINLKTFVSLSCLFLGLMALAPLSGCTPTRPMATVERVDLSRYMGRWYVIAMIPTDMEQDAYNAVETYTRNPDGSICTWYRLRSGSFSAPIEHLHSTATLVPGSHQAEWRVHIYWLLNFQYLVGWLNGDYSQVMVVRSARDHLWYMARTPQVSKADYRAMLIRAAAMGYDTSKIVAVPQRWPENTPTSHAPDADIGQCP